MAGLRSTPQVELACRGSFGCAGFGCLALVIGAESACLAGLASLAGLRGLAGSGNPAKRARAIVEATTNYDDPDTIARVSRDLGEAMVGIEISDIPENELMAGRGW